MQELISAIDVGTTKVCALTAAVTHDSLGALTLRLLGAGQAASRGIRRGVVVHVAEASAAIAEAVDKCEKEAGRQILEAYVGIAGSHIATLNSTGVSPVDRRHGVTAGDMGRALEGAGAVALPQNTQVIHTIPREWKVDGHGGIQQPLSMTAYRLEVDAHIVTGSSTAVSNLVQCITAHEIDVADLVLEPLASSAAVLRPEERRMGVAVVDLGGGTTDLAVFREGGLCHTEVLDMGGNHLSQDVAVALHTPFETAEALKVRYGHVLPDRVAADETVWATVFGERNERSFSRRFICEVLEARALEVCELIQAKLTAGGHWDKLPAGIVLTGGSSQLPGLAELGRNELGMPVRIGAAQPNLPIMGLTRNLQLPAYATTVGLLLWGLQQEREGAPQDGRGTRRRYAADQSRKGGEWMERAMRWLRQLLPG